MKKKVISHQAAASLIADDSTLATTAFGLSALPEQLLMGLKERYENEKQPSGLAFVCAGGLGNGVPGRGLDYLAAAGLLRKVILSHISLSPQIAAAIYQNQLAAYFLPQGIIARMYRAIAHNSPGVISKIGLHTFVDPRLEGARANEKSTENLVEVFEIEDEEWLRYKRFDVDTAFIRGTYADESGNISFEHEAGKFEALALAMSAKNTGGTVIAQVKKIVKDGTLPPKNILVPGMLVDYLVVADDDHHHQTGATVYDPAFAGEVRVPSDSMTPMVLNTRKVIARRAAQELNRGDIVNLGFGMPDGVANVAREENIYYDILLTLDMGNIGGIPATGLDYGGVYNPEAIISHNAMMDFYDGGGLDLAVLGMGQVDQEGNVNVSRLGTKVVGPGGFINISQATKKIIFVGNFTVGGKYEIVAGKLTILDQGQAKKFLPAVEQVTFSGRYAQTLQQKVLYVTERAVFDLEDGQLRLIEIAPGLDLEADILAWMAFKPLIADSLKEMAADLFTEHWGKLKDMINNKAN